jgi:hypothetical protein
MVKLQEAENQIVIEYEVYDRPPSDPDLLIAAIATHETKLGRIPHLVAADAAFYSAKNEAAAKAKGGKRVCIPNRASKSPARKREQKKRWFRRSGEPVARAASASSSAGTASPAVDTKATLASSAGSGSASSPTTSSISAAPWPNRRHLKPSPVPRYRTPRRPTGGMRFLRDPPPIAVPRPIFAPKNSYFPAQNY